MIPPAEVDAATQAVEDLRSWDRLALRSGQELQGDIVWMRIGGVKAPARH